jgi:hypothetical protein
MYRVYITQPTAAVKRFSLEIEGILAIVALSFPEG